MAPSSTSAKIDGWIYQQLLRKLNYSAVGTTYMLACTTLRTKTRDDLNY